MERSFSVLLFLVLLLTSSSSLSNASPYTVQYVTEFEFIQTNSDFEITSTYFSNTSIEDGNPSDSNNVDFDLENPITHQNGFIYFEDPIEKSVVQFDPTSNTTRTIVSNFPKLERIDDKLYSAIGYSSEQIVYQHIPRSNSSNLSLSQFQDEFIIDLKLWKASERFEKDITFNWNDILSIVDYDINQSDYDTYTIIPHINLQLRDSIITGAVQIQYEATLDSDPTFYDTFLIRYDMETTEMQVFQETGNEDCDEDVLDCRLETLMYNYELDQLFLHSNNKYVTFDWSTSNLSTFNYYQRYELKYPFGFDTSYVYYSMFEGNKIIQVNRSSLEFVTFKPDFSFGNEIVQELSVYLNFNHSFYLFDSVNEVRLEGTESDFLSFQILNAIWNYNNFTLY